MSANMLPTRPGQANNSGDADALFLKVFLGEVIAAFAERNVFMNAGMVRSIDSGKSATFPASWKGGSAYHTPGTLLTGTNVPVNERVITIDDLLVADRFIAQIDEAKNHWDYRRVLSSDIGRALAQQFDKHVAQVGLLTARASATVTGGFGGSRIEDADGKASGTSLLVTLFDAAQALDEKDVPEDDRNIFLKPAQYYNMVETDKALNRDFGGNPGTFSDGTIFRIGGMGVVKTNNLPTTNVTADLAKYNGDFSDTVALVMHNSAVGTVKLIDITTEMEYLIQNQGTLLVGKLAVGHGTLRPESSIEITEESL